MPGRQLSFITGLPGWSAGGGTPRAAGIAALPPGRPQRLRSAGTRVIQKESVDCDRDSDRRP